MVTVVENLVNGSSSKALNVNGSSVAVTFSYSPGNAVVHVTGLVCLFKDEGANDFSKFGALNALTNGILIKTTRGGQDKQLTIIKDNADMATRFPANHFGSSAVLSLLGITTPVGFGGSNNVFVGRLDFTRPLVLSNEDSISVVIRDNLSTIDLFNIVCVVCAE